MHQPPSAVDLLRTVAATLTDDVVPALDGPVQHRARVAANIVEIVAREVELGESVRSHEATLLESIAGSADSTVVAAALRSGAADDPAEHDRIRQLLTEIVRGDLSIAKPGYDAWDGD
jgi:AcrR family transcriptional regulator